MNLLYYVKSHLGNMKSAVFDILLPDRLLIENRKFKDIHKDQSCFILGSGHSIMSQNLTKLAGCIVMTQNHFHSHKDIKIINPKYHVVVPKYQPTDHDKNWEEWFETMETRLPDNTHFFMGKNTKYLIDPREKLNKRTHYLQPGYNAVSMNRARVQLDKRIMKVPTVITQCITIALYMGFRKIYLLGFDLDQMCRIANDRDNLRFYGNSNITDTKAERAYEEAYASSGIDWFNMWSIWKQLNLLKDEANRRSIEIINLTNGGLLNVFPRDKYENIVR
jgi:hypothetical protein